MPGWFCSYKNGALFAKFQPGVLNPCVLICGCLLYLTVNDRSLGEQWILFPETKSSETLRFEGNEIHCSPRRDQSLSDLLYRKTKQKYILKKHALWFQRQHQGHLWSRATAVNISGATVNFFSFDVIVFAMLPAHGIWRETVSLLGPIYTVRLWRMGQVYDRPTTWLGTIYTRTKFSLTKLNLQKFAPGFTERKSSNKRKQIF